MNILLLGGSGLLGHNVLYALLQKNYKVTALVRKASSLRIADFPNTGSLLTVKEGSLLDDASLVAASQGCDAIINCAGTTDMSLLHYEEYLPVNRDLCQRLVSLMEQQQITTLVHASTANTIGFGTPDHPADESAPMQPPFSNSFYAQSKREGEESLLQAAHQHPAWHIVVVNPGFMIGPYDTKPSSGTLLLSAYRKPIMPVPKGGKSFVHVRDVAQAMVNALQQGRSGQRYLVTGTSMTLRQFYQMQARLQHYKQLTLPVPNWLLLALGRIGDILRHCGIRTQLSTRNVRQLMVCEYYDNGLAVQEYKMQKTPINKAVIDFFDYL